MVSTVSLQPEPIPVSVKVVLLGDRVLRDILSEADHWAGQAGADTVEASHLQQAIDEREYRASRVRERSREQISRVW